MLFKKEIKTKFNYFSWEPEESLDCPDVIARYLELHPDERPPKKPKKEKKVKDVPPPTPRDTPKRSTSARVSFVEDEAEDEYEAKKKVDQKKNKKGKGKKAKGGKKAAPKDYEVEKVIDERMFNGKKQYRIRWKGFTAKDDTWEPKSMLNCPELIKAYEKKRKEEVEADFEVQEIIGDKTERGKKFYLVKWKGFSEDESTWEPEASLSCPDLVKKYNNSKNSPSKGKKRSASTAGLSKKKGGAKKAKRPGPKSRTVKDESEEEEDDEESKQSDADDTLNDSEEEWEVQDIMDMRTVKGNKQYLIRWKGCKPSEDTWEPEEQVNCPHIVAKFLKKHSSPKKTVKAKRASKRS